MQSALARGSRIHLGSLSAVLAGRFRERVLIEEAETGACWTAAALEAAVGRLAAAHRAAGLDRGAVLVALENRVDMVLHVLALTRAGAVPAPVNPRLKPEERAAVMAATHPALAPTTPYAVLPPTRVRVVDPEGRPLGWGRMGELRFRGAGVLRGYRGASGAGPDPEGWFTTGDFARAWPGGLFSLAGRRQDRLKVSGFSVFTAEVEAILVEHPAVVDVALVGLPDARIGQRPVALVVPGPGFESAAFLAWARDRVAGYRRPRAVFCAEGLPRGGNGKLDRRAATGLGQSVNGV